MKKFIALGAALIVLLFGFIEPTAVIAAENEEKEFGSGLPLPDFPFD